jgi:hypothetical protein
MRQRTQAETMKNTLFKLQCTPWTAALIYVKKQSGAHLAYQRLLTGFSAAGNLS